MLTWGRGTSGDLGFCCEWYDVAVVVVTVVAVAVVVVTVVDGVVVVVVAVDGAAVVVG